MKDDNDIVFSVKNVSKCFEMAERSVIFCQTHYDGRDTVASVVIYRNLK